MEYPSPSVTASRRACWGMRWTHEHGRVSILDGGRRERIHVGNSGLGKPGGAVCTQILFLSLF